MGNYIVKVEVNGVTLELVMDSEQIVTLQDPMFSEFLREDLKKLLEHYVPLLAALCYTGPLTPILVHNLHNALTRYSHFAQSKLEQVKNGEINPEKELDDFLQQLTSLLGPSADLDN